jgi:hypothetical protein
MGKHVDENNLLINDSQYSDVCYIRRLTYRDGFDNSKATRLNTKPLKRLESLTQKSMHYFLL